MDAEERRHAGVAARQLQHHQPRGERAHAGAAVALDRRAGDAQRGQLRDDLEGKLGALPILVDDGNHVTVAERTHLVADRALLIREQLIHAVEVGAERAGDVCDHRVPSFMYCELLKITLSGTPGRSEGLQSPSTVRRHFTAASADACCDRRRSSASPLPAGRGGRGVRTPARTSRATSAATRVYERDRDGLYCAPRAAASVSRRVRRASEIRTHWAISPRSLSYTS